MFTGVVIRDIQVDGAGNWSSHIGRQTPNRRIEVQQKKLGRPWSAWAGTNVTERFVGVRFMHNYTTNYLMTIQSGGHHQITWAYPHLAFNDRNIWMNSYAPGAQWYEVRIKGDITVVHVEPGVNVQLLDFYNPGRGNPVYLKVNGGVAQVWNPVQ